LLKKLDARLRGHDGKNSPTAHLYEVIIFSKLKVSFFQLTTDN